MASIDERIVARQLTLLDVHHGGAEAVLSKAGVTCSLARFLSSDLAAIDSESLMRVAGVAAREICNVDADLVGRPLFRGEDWQLMLYCLTGSSSLREAMTRASAFHRAVDGRFGIMELDVRGGTAELCFSTLVDPLSRLGFVSSVFGLMNIHGLFSWMIGRQIPVPNMFLAYAEQVRDFIEPDLIPFPLTLGANRCALQFPASYLDYPVFQAFEEWDKPAKRCFFVCMDRDGTSDSIAEHARRAMLRALRQGDGLRSLDQLAADVGFNRETFRRRLRTVGLSYNLIKDSCRRELGLELIHRTSLSMEEISHRLDFCDSDEFRRAVHKWIGLSPSAYRRNCKIGVDCAESEDARY